MKAIRLALLAGASALVLATPTGAMTVPKLTGTVGPAATISLKKAGKKVTTLKRGKYTFVISDKSSFHNFHLTGPGVNKLTTVTGTGTKTWTVTLKPGRYTYRCDPHRSFMNGSFRVT